MAGRHLVNEDVESARPVAVIGADLVDTFFAQGEPLGKLITVDGHEVKVVGVAERKGKVFGESQDNFAWIPINTFRKFFGSRRSITIQAAAASMDEMEDAQDQARLAMRIRRHLDYDKPDDFSIETGESVMEFWQSATRGIYVVTIVVTGHLAAGGRGGGHEHHAGVGDRAHPRDRRAQGPGRPAARHHAPVPGGVGGAVGARRCAGRRRRGRLLLRRWPRCWAPSCRPTSRPPCACGRC